MWKLALMGPRITLAGESYGKSVLYSFGYTFLGVDPCYPRMRTDLLQRDVRAALLARGGRPQQWPDENFLPKGDPAYSASLGCETPKIAVAHDYLGAESGAQALDLLKSATDPLKTPVLEAPSGAPERSAALPGGAVGARVTGFSANRVEVEVSNDTRGGWLYYADAFHPGWRARVGNTETPVVRANAGFKAVAVPPGNQVVVLTFGDGVRRCASWLTAAAGALACLAGILVLAVCALRRRV
jgi:hypothetical protein